MKKRVLSLLAGLTVAALALTGCGGDTAGSSSSSAAKTLKVGATAVPHAEILEAVKPVLEKDGVKLEIVEFNDYVQPNLALNDKELDANFFQHKPYLDNFMEEHKDVKLKSAFGVHIEPMGIYSKKVSDLKDLKEGSKYYDREGIVTMCVNCAGDLIEFDFTEDSEPFTKKGLELVVGRNDKFSRNAYVKLNNLSGGAQSSALAKMFSSHPDSAKRAAKMRKKADQLTWQETTK